MKRKGSVSKVVYYVVMIALSFFMVLPLFWMITTSLKDSGALTAIPIEWIPKKVTLDSFRKLFEIFPFGKAFLNSVIVSVSITIVNVFSACMAAYVFAKIPFKGRELLFGIFLITMMIPGSVTLIPNYLILRSFHLLNSYLGLVLPSFFNIFGIFMLRQSMRQIPDDFIDAAVIDGASQWKIFFNVIIPLSRPMIATLFVITFMGAWNDYLWPLIVLTDKNKMTLPVALSMLNGQYSTEYNLLMAGALISIVPIIIVYAFAQRYFEEGLTAGGLKG
ncbi:MAG TPA: carbohydrate ABC transporter permease [Fervidobacterium sp.]|nr:carbohydrate ABC transporter permease [Fervidobacterium sp.]NLH36706.1 carbohydrate ABC transporter permease [Thermotogaceae bacterium]HOA17677.1 carbohydrate ABC transporter permease [Fervidobacterium sp.]HOH53998.1 carbohydrate ABC transporter permease [Fervidobacterium sp.]HOL04272.1 carbohydrate ABC transporter permease [Fervidobacterium sp.]